MYAFKTHEIFRALNALYICKISVASDIVILHLTRTFCLPTLLYGLESFTVSRSCLNAIEFCWNRAMFKIFNTGSRDNVNCVLYYTGILPLSYQIDLRKLRFYYVKHLTTSVSGTDGIVWHALIATSKRMVDTLIIEKTLVYHTVNGVHALFHTSKTAKIMKVILLRAPCQNVNVLLSNITFIIFAVFDV